jgi:hypothetical protein
MKLRIWHNSNLGNPHFERDVPDVETAKQWLKLLADYDLYQGDKVVANAQGLMVLEGSEWNEWEDENGNDISAVMAEEDEAAENLSSRSSVAEQASLKRRVVSSSLTGSAKSNGKKTVTGKARSHRR